GEHFWVIVAFEKDGIKRGNKVNEILEHMAQVRQDAETLSASLDDERGPVHAVMGRRDSVHKHVAKPKLALRLEVADISHFPERTPRRSCCECRGRHIYRQTIFSLQYAGVSDVIGVVVRDNHGIDITNVAAARSESFFCLSPRDSCVENKLDSASFDINAVAAAA